MRLSQVLDGVAPRGWRPDRDVELTGLSYDSRTLCPGALFVAIPGCRADGQDFIREARQRGAAFVLCQHPPEGVEVPFLVVEDTRRALALASANWFGHPDRALTLIGVTGTNGKTTCTYLVRHILEAALSARVGLIGTNQNLVGGEALPASRTTPESWELHRLLRQMADRGCTHVVMEVSSHALALGRVEGLWFRVGLFTNLTRDHLDFHGTMERYRAAKERLFSQCGCAVLNVDDGAGRYFAGRVPCRVRTYGRETEGADLTAGGVRCCPDRVEFTAHSGGRTCPVTVPIPGGFTVSNALGALGCCLELGVDLEAAASALANAEGVRGRLERVPTGLGFTVLLDYAHTPDALERVLQSLRSTASGRLLCLFGCGGDRDRGKRPRMGAIAAQLADIVVLTSDNPRSEDPLAILRDIRAGTGQGRAQVLTEPDRERAIGLALSLAQPGDTVLLAGKGHELWQETGIQRRPMDERAIVRDWCGEKIAQNQKNQEASAKLGRNF